VIYVVLASVDGSATIGSRAQQRSLYHRTEAEEGSQKSSRLKSAKARSMSVVHLFFMFAISSRTLHSESDDDGKALGQVNDASCLQNAANTNQPPPPILKTKHIFLVLFSFPANQLRPFLAAEGTMLHPSDGIQSEYAMNT
jgi:hypothetical protein